MPICVVLDVEALQLVLEGAYFHPYASIIIYISEDIWLKGEVYNTLDCRFIDGLQTTTFHTVILYSTFLLVRIFHRSKPS